MKVLQLSTSAVGGAAIAGQRIHAALLQSGVDSVFAARGDVSAVAASRSIELRRSDGFRSSLVTATNRALAHSPVSFFSPMSAAFVSPEFVASVRPDAIIVHNWYNLLGTSRAGMLLDLGIPLVFVLHDERLFTGGCHYALDCRGFAGDCGNCPQARPWAQSLVSHRRAVTEGNLQVRPHVNIVAPSQWLAEEARASRALRTLPITHIPNPIDAQVFSPEGRSAARRKYGLADDALVIAWQPGKGDELMPSVIAELYARLGGELMTNVVILHTGSDRGDVVPLKAVAAGSLVTETERAEFWAAADVSLTLTEFDNFPNIVLESLACGTPMVVPRIGGTTEAVDATGGGVLVERTAAAIAQGLVALLADGAARAAAAGRAASGVVRHYNYELTARRYMALLS